MNEEIGVPWVPSIRMEEEEEKSGGGVRRRRPIGFGTYESEDGDQDRYVYDYPDAIEKLLKSLAEERKVIVNDEKLSAKQKQALLDENRKTLVVATGGSIRKTDSVVYGILIFGGVVLVVLALLTTFADLPSEVTLAFVGTVLGGTIATIAQKLGKI